MATNLKDLIFEALLDSLIEFTVDKTVKIIAANTYYPEIDEIRSALNKTSNALDTYVIITSGDRKTTLHRTNEYEEITQDGEFIYYYHSEDSIMVNITCFTDTQERADQVLDYLSHFCSAVHLIPVIGSDEDTSDLDYFKQYFTYQYYNPLLYSSMRLKGLDSMMMEHEGELFSIDYMVELNLKRMLSTKLPALDTIIVTNEEGTQSGSVITISGADHGQGFNFYEA